LVVADITNPFFTEFVQVVGQVAQEAGFSVLLCNTDQNIEKERFYLRLLKTHRVDGVILALTGTPEDYMRSEIFDYRLPLVLVDRTIPHVDLDSVVLDNEAAALEATDYILDLGHRRVGIITGPGHLSSASERLDGFRKALDRRGVPFDPALVRNGNFNEAEAFDVTKDLLATNDRPTALFVVNNHMLIGVMRAITALRLNCPADISVAAIDDFPWANAFTPRLTTVRQPIREMGEGAMQLLLRRLSDDDARKQAGAEAGDAPAGRRMVLQSHLIVRESCAPLVRTAASGNG
jgi:LacI family transcriptional regulator